MSGLRKLSVAVSRGTQARVLPWRTVKTSRGRDHRAGEASIPALRPEDSLLGLLRHPSLACLHMVPSTMILKLQRDSVREVLVETHTAGPCEAVSDSLVWLGPRHAAAGPRTIL